MTTGKARAYYNEFDPYAAQWLRNLIAERLIPNGDVDERSIVEVAPSDLAGYTQCHFFAGIGGWALAARLAGWPDDREIWTGSPPCQPFSVAGKGKAQADDRHLWPHLFRLASARRPAVLMGEQVAAAVGKNWLDGVFADLEGIGYACGAAVVPACAVDAPHRRDRLWFVAHTAGEGRRQAGLSLAGDRPADRAGAGNRTGDAGAAGNGAGTVADADLTGTSAQQEQRGRELGGAGGDPGACAGGALADAGSAGREQGEWHDQADGHGYPTAAAGGAGRHGGSAWTGAAWIIGHDGKARRVEPGIRLLAHGVSGRMAVVRPGFEGRAEVPEALHWYSRSGALKGFGNAIVPQVAAEVIGAYLDCYPTA